MPRVPTGVGFNNFRNQVVAAEVPEYPGMDTARAGAYAAATRAFWRSIQQTPGLAPETQNAVDPVEEANMVIDAHGDGSAARIRDRLLSVIEAGLVDAFYIRLNADLEDARYGLDGRLKLVIDNRLPEARGRGIGAVAWPVAANLVVLVPCQNSNGHDYREGIPVRVHRPNPAGMDNVYAVDSRGHAGNSLRIMDCRPPTAAELQQFAAAEIQGVDYARAVVD